MTICDLLLNDFELNMLTVLLRAVLPSLRFAPCGMGRTFLHVVLWFCSTLLVFKMFPLCLPVGMFMMIA